MNIRSSLPLLGATVLCGVCVTAAQAQVTIFNQDFDGGYTGSFGTSSYGGGTPTGTGNAVVTSGGNPNGAWTATMTTTTWGDYYGGQLQIMTVSGNTDPTPSDYVLSFDAYGSSAAGIQIGLQAWQGNWFGGSQIMNLTLNDALSAANTWQTFSVNLGTLAGANPTGATWQLNFQMNSWQWGGPGNTDSLTIDNVKLVQVASVPEPGSLALAGLGLALLLRCRQQAR
jgi:hypothetical protein